MQIKLWNNLLSIFVNIIILAVLMRKQQKVGSFSCILHITKNFRLVHKLGQQLLFEWFCYEIDVQWSRPLFWSLPGGLGPDGFSFHATLASLLSPILEMCRL